MDPEYVGTAKLNFERRRLEDSNRSKPEMAMAIADAIEHCVRATRRALHNAVEGSGVAVRYQPMAFVPEWAIHGGKSGNRKCFNAEKLMDRWGWCVTLTPSMRDDDKPQIDFVAMQVKNGNEAMLLTNDNFRNHIQDGKITREWFTANVVSYVWIPKIRDGVSRTVLMLNDLPEHLQLPHLQGGGG